MKLGLNRNNILKLFLTTSLLLFIISLTQDAYRAGGQYAGSFACVIVGWMGVPIGGTWANITWLANPILVIAWIGFISDRKTSLICSSVAFILSLSFLFCSEVTQNEAGSSSHINGYAIGYYLWLSSSFLLIGGNIILLKLESQSKEIKKEKTL